MRVYESVKDTDVVLADTALSGAFDSNGQDYVRELFRKSPKTPAPPAI